MSLVIKSKNFPEHIPKNPRKFEFDEEVAPIFENMALRSIPNYRDMHSINAQLILRDMACITDGDYVVVDYGASTGMAMKAVCTYLDIPQHQKPPGLRYIALDSSLSMLEKTIEQIPWAETVYVDCTNSAEVSIRLSDIGATPHCVLMLYFLQFLPLPDQLPVLRNANSLLMDDGLFLFGGKEQGTDHDEMYHWFSDIYYDLRREMGYSDEEIRAKSVALQNSMFMRTKDGMISLLDKAGFGSVYETTRWLQFMSMVARKKTGR